MKGTIDIQIKRKDGSIENRHEHNVVFDIPSLTFKKWSESPLAMATGVPTPSVTLTSNHFQTFCLSEDTISITEPSFVPVTLQTVTSSSTKWYNGPATITTNPKSKIISATWTVGEAITLKSIFFSSTSLTGVFSRYLQYRLTSKDNIYQYNSETSRFRKELMDFSGFLLNSSTSWNGLVSSAVSSSFTSINDPSYVDYPLCNPDERFVFSYPYQNNTRYTSNPTHAGSNGTVISTLEIRNKDTTEIIRSFPMTQFTGFEANTNNVYRVYVVNTGTKNVLAQPTTDGKSLNLWQIPDTATEDAIPISATVLQNQCAYTSTNSDTFKVVGPYIAVQMTNADYDRNPVRITDDFSAITYHGVGGDNKWTTYQYDSNYGNIYPTKYRSGKMFLYRDSTSNNAYYSPAYPNITASNFSTPIVLAEGDVLTVSYKIEVA